MKINADLYTPPVYRYEVQLLYLWNMKAIECLQKMSPLQNCCKGENIHLVSFAAGW